MVVLVMASGTAACAQDLAGTWQGTLQAGKPLRLVFVVSRAADGDLQGTMHSIDQGGQGVSVAPIVVQGAGVRMSVGAVGGTFEGRLSADGASIDGTWAQGPGFLPLILARATSSTARTIPGPPKPMAADARVVFEVAAIKPSNAAAQGKLFTVKGRQVLTINTTLADLISFAYVLHPGQISGGPPWMNTERYDVTGQPEAPGQPSQAQLRAMVEALLADRFKLAFHHEPKDLRVYAVVVGDRGRGSRGTTATRTVYPVCCSRA